MEEAPLEASACATGLAALVRAVERQVLNALQAALTAFFGQARALPCALPFLVVPPPPLYTRRPGSRLPA